MRVSPASADNRCVTTGRTDPQEDWDSPLARRQHHSRSPCTSAPARVPPCAGLVANPARQLPSGGVPRFQPAGRMYQPFVAAASPIAWLPVVQAAYASERTLTCGAGPTAKDAITSWPVKANTKTPRQVAPARFDPSASVSSSTSSDGHDISYSEVHIRSGTPQACPAPCRGSVGWRWCGSPVRQADP